MDTEQTNHLKAYGIAYRSLQKGNKIHWLLNYKGGSFLIPASEELKKEALLKGISFEECTEEDYKKIAEIIDKSNMEDMLLEKAPRIGIYTPPNKQPWDDAVTLALTYAEIPYKALYDVEILKEGKLKDIDWLHLHHEDFTGQYGKFYSTYKDYEWYKQDQEINERIAKELGFAKVSKLKLAIVLALREFIEKGGFLFAMCSASETLDIALAAQNLDIVPEEFDGDGYDREADSKLLFNECLVFENFKLSYDPYIYKFSDIDVSDEANRRGENGERISLFSFSAKLDFVPTMLTQCHQKILKGFLGQTTGFHKQNVKKRIIILADVPGTDEIKYIHGVWGKGMFAFLGGHDPEDFKHMVGEDATNLDLHKNSPGYRLILNNVLFPAAKKKRQKT